MKTIVKTANLPPCTTGRGHSWADKSKPEFIYQVFRCQRCGAVVKYWPNPTPCHHCDEPNGTTGECWWCGKPQDAPARRRRKP